MEKEKGMVVFMNDPVDRGGIVLSSAGHDKGKHFFVVGAEENGYLLLADGKFRPIEKPKKKKTKHCRLCARCGSEKIAEKLAVGAKIENAELRKALNMFLSEEGTDHG